MTTEPGPDVAPYHDRQIVVFPPDAWPCWLDLSATESALLGPCLARALTVHEVYP